MGIRQDMNNSAGLTLRFSDGVNERWREVILALLSGWLNGVMWFTRGARYH